MAATPPTLFRTAIALALSTCLVLAWLSLGVGIIGADGDPANRMYFGVIGLGVAVAAVTRLRPGGLAWAMLAMAAGQTAVTVAALVMGLGMPYSGPAELVLLNGLFIALFCTASVLFRRAARAGA